MQSVNRRNELQHPDGSLAVNDALDVTCRGLSQVLSTHQHYRKPLIQCSLRAGI